MEGSNGWPARAMKGKPPHDFCPEGPCPRAWHRTGGYLSVAPISIRFERFTVFHTSGSAGGHNYLTDWLIILFDLSSIDLNLPKAIFIYITIRNFCIIF
jgi:hypothetical protein